MLERININAGILISMARAAIIITTGKLRRYVFHPLRASLRLSNFNFRSSINCLRLFVPEQGKAKEEKEK